MSDLPESLPRPQVSSGIGKGWWPIVERLHAQLLELDPDYRVDQVKEKFGGLRYYFGLSEGVADGVRERADHLVDEAESEAGRTCESCGAPGEARLGGWVLTLCDACHARRENARASEDDG